jgi:toxin ParE1/3/4
MAEVVWTEPALADLDTIADYIALENPGAARRLVQLIFEHVRQPSDHPRSGSALPEFRRSRYRQIVEPPCRVIHRIDKRTVYILHVVRGERLLRRRVLTQRAKRLAK